MITTPAPRGSAPLSIASLRIDSDRRLVAVMLCLQGTPPVWFALQEVFLAADGPVPLPRVLVRLMPAFPPVIGLLLLPRMRTAQAYSRFAFAVGLAIAATMLVSFGLRPEAEDLPLRARVVTPALLYLLLPNTLARQIAPPLFLSAGMVAMRAYRLPDWPLAPMITDLVLLGVLNVAGVMLVHRRRALERRVDEAWQGEVEARAAAKGASEELRTLRGIIPICSFCRHVRTDAGWQQVESYVQAHTEAQFSHGVCPTCRARHYGEYSKP